MEYPCTERILLDKKGKHEYITYELKYPQDKDEFLKYILPVLREEYGFGCNLDEKVKNINPERLKTIKKFMAKANTPNPDKSCSDKRPWLKNTRSKISECIAKDLLAQLESVCFTCRVSEEEEDPDMPKRGIDNFGFIFKEENDDLRLNNIVTCEVKTSDSSKSPPAVVHDSDDSMFKSLKSMSDIDIRLKKAIAKSIDKLSEGQYLELICDVAENIETDDELDAIKSKIVVVPFLLRKKENYTEKDYGKFKTHSENFPYATIKYYIMTIDYELNDFADEVYTQLREG